MNSQFCRLARLLITGAAVTLAGCLCSAGAASPSRDDAAILFVPGFNDSGESWVRSGYIRGLEATGDYHYRGEARWVRDRLEIARANNPRRRGPRAVYTLTFPDRGTGPIAANGTRLAEAIARIRRDSGVAEVRLVTFSLGGIIAREFLTSPGYRGGVTELITIAAPHSGSEFCLIPAIYQQLRAESDRWQGAGEDGENLLAGISAWGSRQLGHSLGAALDGLCSNDQTKRYLTSRALTALVPDDPGSYVAQLNARPHPHHLVYRCLILRQSPGDYGSAALREDWQHLRTGDLSAMNLLPLAQDLTRTLTRRAMPRGSERGQLSGDGVVSVQSQDLNQVRAFRRDVRLKAELKTIGGAHAYDPSARSEVLRWLGASR